MITDGFSPIIQHAVSVLNGLDYVIYLFSSRWCGFFEGKDELRRRLVCFFSSTTSCDSRNRLLNLHRVKSPPYPCSPARILSSPHQVCGCLLPDTEGREVGPPRADRARPWGALLHRALCPLLMYLGTRVNTPLHSATFCHPRGEKLQQSRPPSRPVPPFLCAACMETAPLE